MPQKPLKPCRQPGCNVLTRSGFCDGHKPERIDNRPSAHRRGYTSKWAKASKGFLASHPWCAECLKAGRHTPATQTDHIIPHKGDMALFWDRSNWQPLCDSCHGRKTAREDGGFGHTPLPKKV